MSCLDHGFFFLTQLWKNNCKGGMNLLAHKYRSQCIMEGSQDSNSRQEPEAETMENCCLLNGSLAFSQAHTQLAILYSPSPLT